MRHLQLAARQRQTRRLMRRLQPAARRRPSRSPRLLRQLPRSSVDLYLQSALPSWLREGAVTTDATRACYPIARINNIYAGNRLAFLSEKPAVNAGVGIRACETTWLRRAWKVDDAQLARGEKYRSMPRRFYHDASYWQRNHSQSYSTPSAGNRAQAPARSARRLLDCAHRQARCCECELSRAGR